MSQEHNSLEWELFENDCKLTSLSELQDSLFSGKGKGWRSISAWLVWSMNITASPRCGWAQPGNSYQKLLTPWVLCYAVCKQFLLVALESCRWKRPNVRYILLSAGVCTKVKITYGSSRKSVYLDQEWGFRKNPQRAFIGRDTWRHVLRLQGYIFRLCQVHYPWDHT